MDYQNDKRIVLTLDAGGTNFVFSAIQGNRAIVDDVRLPAKIDQLDESLDTLIAGFQQVIDRLDVSPVAISFVFPGPADYPAGIIDNMNNLPAFYGGVALGPFLEEQFQMPVFIHNDGDLFTYGEAMAGFLPKVNQMLEASGSPKRFKNLLGVTLGTGLGGGFVCDGKLCDGDNSAATEIWIARNRLRPDSFAEEGASRRAVKNGYAERVGLTPEEALEPKEVYEIGIGEKPGDQESARAAFHDLGQIVGDVLAEAVSITDSLIVVGGGLAGAYPLFIPAILEEMRGQLTTYDGKPLDRMCQKVFDLEDGQDLHLFMQGKVRELTIPRSDKTILYDSLRRVGIGRSVLGTSHAVAVGAYAIALDKIG